MTSSRSIVVGTAGHIDHGKSALVRALTGTDPDRLKDEQARGITIDLGFAHLRRRDVEIAFVDVPGHERFVRNMLAGAGGFDAVLLVVAADEGVMPQTREHLAICRLLGLSRGVVALTKIDAADADMRAVAELDVRELVEGTFLENAEIVPVSARTGDGLEAIGEALARLAVDETSRPATGPVRFPVDRVFTMKGFGTVVTGTLVSGTIEEGRDYTLLPAGRAVRVRGLQSYGTSRTSAAAGRRLAVNLSGIEVGDIARGDTLAVPGAFTVTRRFDAIVENDSSRPIRNGARVRVYQGTSELMARITVGAEVGADVQATGDATATVNAIEPGRRAFARLRLEAPAVLTRGDRFVLRSYSPLATIGGGTVLDPEPRQAPVRSPRAAARFAQLAPAAGQDDAGAVAAMIDEAGVRGLMIEELTSRAGLTHDQVQAIAMSLGGAVTRLGARIVSSSIAQQLEARVIDVVRAHHAVSPLSDGLPREELRERALPGVPHDIAAAVIARLEGGGRLTGRERLALPGHAPTLSADEARASEAVRAAVLDRGYAAPDAKELATVVQASGDLLTRVLTLLVRQKQLIRLDTLYYRPETLDELRADVRQLTSLDVATFKARYGLTRKHAIPLLEYLDRERVTRRVGDTRVVNR